MDEDKCVELLEKHGVKSTANRIMIVKALAEEENPKSVKELEDKLVLIDKSNIFRALTIFRKHHLVHTIEDGNGGIRYELCMSHSSVDDDDEHVHFFCEKCGKTFCLNSTPVPAVQLPEGYVHRSSNFLVKGLCPACAGKHGTPSLKKTHFGCVFLKVEISCFSHLFPLFFIALAHAEKNIRLIAKNTRHLF